MDEIAEAVKAGMEALKAGRHSRTDHEMLQTIHDHAQKLGASCGSEEKSVERGLIEKKSISLDERRKKISDAIYALAPFAAPVQPATLSEFWIVELYDDYAIVEVGASSGSNYYKVPYQQDQDGNVTVTQQVQWLKVEKEWVEAKMLDSTLITYGGEIKAIGGGKLRGKLITFSTDDDPDLTTDYFDKTTDYALTEGRGKSHVYYHHGLNPTLKKRRMTNQADLIIDDEAVWFEHELERANRYEAMIYKLAEAGKLRLSSGTAAHLVEREPVGKAFHVKSWPLGLDASYTTEAAEPRNKVVPLKSLVIDTDELELEAAPEASHDAATAAESKTVILPTEEQNTEDIMTDEIKAMLQQVIDGQKKVEELAAEVKGIKDKLEAEPPIKTAGFAVEDEKKSKLDPLSGKDEKPFKSFGEQLQAVYRAAVNPSAVDKRLFEVKAAGLGESVPSEGGFLVQEDFAAELWRRTYTIGQIIQRVRRIPISANSNGLKMNAIAETSRAAGSRYGGVRAYWMAEAGLKSDTHPAFRQIELNLHKLAAVCYATDELLQDATALGAVIQQVFPEEINYTAEDSFINGTGAGQPLGILAAGCTTSVAKETGQAAQTVVSENIKKMWSRLWAPSRGNAVWLINQDVEPQLWSLTENVGTGGMPVFLPPGGLSQSPYSSLFGRPIIPVEYCPTLGTVGDILLCDWSQYLTIDKGGIQSASSIHVRFLYDEATFRFVYRIDGQPLWDSVLTPASGSTNYLAPFVSLATRA